MKRGEKYSVYIVDPDGNPLEITSFDHVAVDGSPNR
jgi:extradiol dioxygenase family protein